MSLDSQSPLAPYESTSFATPKGALLLALCLVMLMSPKAEQREDFPLRGKYREAGIGVHFHQAQPGWHVFLRAKGAVVWFYQKRRPLYLKGRPPQAQRARLMSPV